MNIEVEQDIERFMSNFKEFAVWNPKQQKHILEFEDILRKGTWKLMMTNGQWSLRGSGKRYIDLHEDYLSRRDIERFLWDHRVELSYALQH